MIVAQVTGALVTVEHSTDCTQTCNELWVENQYSAYK